MKTKVLVLTAICAFASAAIGQSTNVYMTEPTPFARPKGDRIRFRRRHLDRSGRWRHRTAACFAFGDRIEAALLARR
jgi:hypothetical protein